MTSSAYWLVRWFLVLLLIIAFVLAAYWLLASIVRYPLDKSVAIKPPTSPKSQPEFYQFGFQPALQYSEQREPCAQRYPLKKAFFGDLHIHTALSADAFPDGTRTFPDAVYRFAQGEKIAMPTLPGRTEYTAELDQPLDFAAVTDHSENLGEGYICRTEGAYPGYHSKACQLFRGGGEKGVRAIMTGNARVQPIRNTAICGKRGEDCAKAAKKVWQSIIHAAELAYDKTAACRFTSFIGYEYTRSTNAMHLHRNTIFKNAEVPDYAASVYSHPRPFSLLQAYEQECRLGIENCDVISIPHNANISGGNAFNPQALAGFDEPSQQAYRQLRNAYDRLMEITQHKGASECINGVTDILGDVDELCEVEAVRQFGQKEKVVQLNAYLPALYNNNSPECSEQYFNRSLNLFLGFCLSSRDFARGALLYGMDEEQSHEVNPFEFGFIGSTDTHLGLAGFTNEAQWLGHIAYETDLAGRLGQADLGRYNRLISNPGGLAGVYAIENSRDALFQSMKRREAFATSGTRIEPRFFAGNFPHDLCQQSDWLKQAYKLGTPMGAKLAAQKKPFQLLLQARADPQSKSLLKLQLVKGWIDHHGNKHNKVIDVIEAKSGADQLCRVFEDADYLPDLPSYYYLRAVELESARWSYQQCQAMPKAKRPDACNNNQPDTIHEMAWTSPIWLTPGTLDRVNPEHDHPHQH